MSGERETYTPPLQRHRDDPEPSWTPAPLRRAAARMNVAAVGLVHRSTDLVVLLGLFVFFVGIGFLLLAMTDFLWHHVVGIWPTAPEVEQLRRLEREHQETLAEMNRWREAHIECLERAERREPTEEGR